MRFGVSGFMLGPLIYLELCFVKVIYMNSCLCRHPVRSATLVEDTSFVLLCISGFFIKNQAVIGI